MKKVLIISHDKIGSQMAGTGIRYHYMAEVLSKDFDVTVGFFGPQYLPDADFKRSYSVEHIDVHQFHKAFEQTDVVIALWVSDAMIDFCNTKRKLLIFDIYAPVPVETLALKVFSGKAITNEDEFAFESSLHDYRKFLDNGDAFLYSNRRQLDFWLGYAFGAGHVTPRNFLSRNVFDQFILAPMGIELNTSFTDTKPQYKGVLKGVEKNDTVIIWNGGIYDWYDGVTLVEAMELLKTEAPHIKLIFPGTTHPNKDLPKWQETIDTIQRSKELDLTGMNIFFFNEWVPYHERIGFLSEADIAIYTHKPSIEAEFSHRTRVLDHILATLPTIATQGDFFAELVDKKELGRTVPPHDKRALADAIKDLAKPENLAKAQKNLTAIRPEFSWESVLSPLTAYLKTNPAKQTLLHPLQLTGVRSKKLRHVKRAIPVPVKKAIVRTLPKRLRSKIIK
jgi:glycosyltransferase involved in cell wall biosynthesis